MGRVLGILLFFTIALHSFSPTVASAYYTPINPGFPEPDLYGVGGVLDHLYGWSNVTRISDGPYPGGDQEWFNPNGSATAEARFAGDQHFFGFWFGTAGGYSDLFQVSGYGYFASGGISGPAFDHNATGTVFRLGMRDVTTGSTWSSRESDNAGATDHMTTWLITGNAGGFGSNVIGNHVVAWEDRNLGDGDYNDLVVELGGVTPVPEPATLALLGLGLGALGLIRSKRKGV